MKLQHEELDDFELLVKQLYHEAFYSERVSKKISFLSENSYIKSCFQDYNKAQNDIANAVIKYFELKSKKEQELKKHRQQRAQKEIIHNFNNQIKILDNRILVLRRLFDSIAFKLFDNKIWVAKRFIVDGKFKSLDIPGIKTNLQAANIWNSEHSLDFALVSNLTTFIELGDLLLTLNTSNRFKWLVAELKTGKVNIQLFNLLENEQTNWKNEISKLDNHTFKQLKRILLQKKRTDKAVTLVNNNKGEDIRTGIPLIIKDNNIEWQFYDKGLRDTIEGAKQEKVSLVIIEDCLSIFASTLSDFETFHFLYHIIYRGANCYVENSPKSEGAQKEVASMQKLLNHPYVVDLTWHNMYKRWRTPFFCLPIENVALDLLFGRMRVVLYFDINKFIELCSSKGLRVELHSKQTTNFIRTKFPNMPLHNGRAMKIVSKNGESRNIGDGLFNRLYYDLVTPSTLIKITMSLPIDKDENLMVATKTASDNIIIK